MGKDALSYPNWYRAGPEHDTIEEVRLFTHGWLMPTFMLESGRLAPVTHQEGIPDGFSEQWCALVRPDVLELTDTAAFAVAWNGSRTPVLTAMDADGAVLTAAVLPALDMVTLSELIAVAGRARMLPWADIAARYPRGAAAFRRDWNAFRETSPRPGAPVPSLLVVAGSVSEHVMWSLPLLEQVRIVGARLRRGPGDSHLLDLAPVSTREISRSPGTATPSRRSPSTSAPPRRSPATDRSAAPDTPPHRSPSSDGASRVPAGTDPSPQRSPAVPVRSRRRAVADPAEPAATPTATTVPSPEEGPSPDEPADSEALELVATMVQAPAAIELRHHQARHRATLNAGGAIVLPDGTRYTDLGKACADLLGDEHPDPWRSWLFTEGQLPLAEARAEALWHRSRGHVKRNGAATGRRARA